MLSLLVLFILENVSCVEITLSNLIINTTDPQFVSYTIDTNQVDNHIVNISDPKLIYLASQLSGYLRIGGTAADYTYYQVGDEDPCNLPTNQSEKYYCMSVIEFDGYVNFAQNTNSKLVFGLSMGYPLYPQSNTMWNYSNTQQFLRHLHYVRHYNSSHIYGFELGNEVSNDDPYNNAIYQSNAFRELRGIIDGIWGSDNNIKLFGPDPHSYILTDGDTFNYFVDFVRESCTIMDGITYHSYVNENKSQLLTVDGLNEQYLHSLKVSNIWNDPSITEQSENCADLVHRIWAGEIAEHDAKGAPSGLLNTYYDGFWFLDALGTLSNLGHAVFARQCLAHSAYGLLDDDYNPYCDYYTALLFDKLMSHKVIKIESENEKLRLYAHCSRHNGNNAVTIAFININEREITMKYNDKMLDWKQVYVWFLTPDDTKAGLSSSSMALNGILLQLTNDDKLPSLEGERYINDKHEIKIPRTMYGYIMFNNTNLTVCA